MFTPFISDVVQSFDAYVPGRSIDEVQKAYGVERVVKLASNENPLGVPPLALERLRGAADRAFLYPQAGNPRLCAALGREHGVDPARIIATNGSDECIDLLFRACAVPGKHNVVAFDPCFGIYSTQAKLAGVEFRQAPLKVDFAFDFEGLLSLCDENTTMVFVTNPDNPSGYAVGKEELARLAERLPKGAMLVVDEAYVDFARSADGGEEAFSVMGLLDRHPNMAVLRTFSKSRGLAGIRLGYAVLPGVLASYLWRIRLPFSVNILVEEAGLAALRDVDFRRATLETAERGRILLEESLRKMGWRVLRTQANFMMATCDGIDMACVNEGLLRHGVIVRWLRSYGLPAWLRISVGTEEQNCIFLDALAAVMAERRG